MNVTSTGLARAAGAAAATAGAIFVAVQVNHPAETAFDTDSASTGTMSTLSNSKGPRSR